MDQGQLDALYQQYLGRGVDSSGAANWANADYNTVVQGILGSQEYQNRQNAPVSAVNVNTGQSSGPATNQGGTDINSIYQQYLGRNVDPSGAATYAGWNPQDIVNAILGSQEYASLHPGGGGGGGSAPAAQPQAQPAYTPPSSGDYNFEMTGRPSDQELATNPELAAAWNNYARAATASGSYNTPTAPQTVSNPVYEDPNYWNSGKTAYQAGDGKTYYAENWVRPSDYVSTGYAAPYTKEQISGTVDPSWIRKMNGQTYASVKGPSDLSGGEYLVDPNTGKFVLDKNGNPVGVTYPKSSGFDDWVTTPLGGLAMTFGVPLAAFGGVAALEGLGAATGAGAGALETAGAGGLSGGGAFIPAAGSGANFGIIPGAAYTSAGLTGTTLGSLGAGGAFTPAAGASFEIVPGATYGISEAAAASALAKAGLTGAQIANYAKTGLSVAGLAAKLLGATGLTGSTGSSGANQSNLANALKNSGSSGLAGSSGTGSQLATNFALSKGNVNPFSYGKEIPVQTQTTNRVDPFASLNVAQTPIAPYNPLAHLVG